MPKMLSKERLAFKELTFKQQADRLTATMAYLRQAVRAHVRKARETKHDADKTLTKCIKQIERLKTNLEK
jgi:hypothetical protein